MDPDKFDIQLTNDSIICQELPSARAYSLCVHIPMRCESIRIESIAGDVDVCEIETETLHVKIKAGDISVKNSEIEQMNLTTVSGDIKIDGHVIDMECLTESGDIDVDCDAFANGILQTTTGDIELNTPVNTYEALFCKTTAGDILIDCKNIPAMELEMKTKLGDCESNKSYAQGVCKTTLQTTTGDIEVQ